MWIQEPIPDEISKCGHSSKSYSALPFCGVVYYAINVQGGANFSLLF